MNNDVPIDSTVSGISISTNDMQLSKTESPSDVTLSPIVIEFNEPQLLKAPVAIDEIGDGIEISMTITMIKMPMNAPTDQSTLLQYSMVLSRIIHHLRVDIHHCIRSKYYSSLVYIVQQL